VRALVITWVVVLGLPPGLAVGETLQLSRSLKLDFRHPGSIHIMAAQGKRPVSERVQGNSYVLVLPKQVELRLSIAGDNDRRHHYHICVKIQKGYRAAEKVEDVISPDRVVRNLWLAKYRYQFTILNKHATPRNEFVNALVRLDVYAPGEK